jgi:hypothetical protein
VPLLSSRASREASIFVSTFEPETEAEMAYFEPETAWPEQLGKLIGDAVALAVVAFVIVLVASSLLR